MPSLFRFLIVAGVLAAVVFGGLYVAQVLLEPDQGRAILPLIFQPAERPGAAKLTARELEGLWGRVADDDAAARRCGELVRGVVGECFHWRLPPEERVLRFGEALLAVQKQGVLVEEAGVRSDHVHGTAERLEHVTSPTLQQDLAAAVGEAAKDPHGKAIPGGG